MKKEKMSKLEWFLVGFAEFLLIIGIIFLGKYFESIFSTPETFFIVGMIFIILSLFIKYTFEAYFLKISSKQK